MSRSKLKKFGEIEKMPNIVEPSKLIYNLIKGNWSQFFGNDNPIILELGCGYGEYTNGLAQIFPNKNFVGVDIKGERVWQGATDSNKLNLSNTAFLRVQIQQLADFFEVSEVAEVWLTFCDPQPNSPKQRLTHPKFLSLYSQILQQNGVVHLKTDSDILFDYTLSVIQGQNLTSDLIQNLIYTKDLYNSKYANCCCGITTRFEKMFVQKNYNIKYLRFEYNAHNPL